MNDGLFQYFQDMYNKYKMKAPEVSVGPKPMDMPQAAVGERDLLAEIAKMNQQRSGSGGILDILGYTDGTIGRQGGMVDQYKNGTGIFGLFGGK